MLYPLSYEGGGTREAQDDGPVSRRRLLVAKGIG